MDLAAARCSAPKTANGIAKHILLSATILSRPRACARSRFAPNIPITKSAKAAEHIEIAMGEISKSRTAKAARIVVSRVMRGCEMRLRPLANDVGEQSSSYVIRKTQNKFRRK